MTFGVEIQWVRSEDYFDLFATIVHLNINYVSFSAHSTFLSSSYCNRCASYFLLICVSNYFFGQSTAHGHLSHDAVSSSKSHKSMPAIIFGQTHFIRLSWEFDTWILVATRANATRNYVSKRTHTKKSRPWPMITFWPSFTFIYNPLVIRCPSRISISSIVAVPMLINILK